VVWDVLSGVFRQGEAPGEVAIAAGPKDKGRGGKGFCGLCEDTWAGAGDGESCGGIKMGKPTIVCLCGSTKFKDYFVKANLEETLAGKIVLTIGCDLRPDVEIFGHLSPEERDRVKAKLDYLHLKKIDLADEVYILNIGGYIGQSTRRELLYALFREKTIRSVEPIDLNKIIEGGCRFRQEE